MTLRLLGDAWVRAEAQEALPADPAALLGVAVGGELRTRAPIPDADGVVVGPLAHDAELVPADGSAGTTRLAGGRVTLLGTGPSGTHAAHFEIIGLRSAARGHLVLDLRTSFRWAELDRTRLLLAIDDTSNIDEQGTLTTPGTPSGAALPFHGQPKAAPSSHARPSGDLPFAATGHSAPTVAAPPSSAPPISMPTAARPAPPPPPLVVVPAVRAESAIEASNRAAGTRPDGAAAPSTEPPRARALDLLWFDPAAGPRLRAQAAWRKLLRTAEAEPVERDDVPLETTADVETRWAVLEIMLRAEVRSVVGWPALLAEAFASRGGLREPLALARGTLRPDFEPLAVLAATCAATRVVARQDARLEPVWKSAFELSREADALTPEIEIDDAARALRGAFADAARPFTMEELDRRIEQALVSTRSFRAVELSGARQIRARLAADDGARVTVYLPEPCAAEWPLAASLRVDLIASVAPPRETALGEPCAGKVVALARHAACLAQPEPERRA
jgi:hypothetical protein